MAQSEYQKVQLERNLKRFMIFRLFYSARFYYPVLTILFLDYGLSLEQFGILNLVWALTIVLAEVPSGALADIVGRKRLLIFAAILMVIEMSLLVLVPIGSSAVLFYVFLANRICSGLSEAAASGADEALAYDSLKALGRENEWGHLLEVTTRVVSIGFFTTMIVGAFAYDSAVVNGVIATLDAQWHVPDEIVIRLPIVLTLITSLIVLGTTLRFYDIDKNVQEQESAQIAQSGSAVRESFVQIIKAGKWTLNHQFILFVILTALALDSVARQFVVLASEYYRVIDIPISWYGFIGAGMALLGIVNARLARQMATHLSPFYNFIILSAILLLSLWGVSHAIPYWGVVFAVGVFLIIGMVQFLASYYINAAVSSKIRATVLSFKGLALNLGLGVASLLYTALVGSLRSGQDARLTDDALQHYVFVEAFKGFPLYYLGLFSIIILLGYSLYSNRDSFFKKPA
ncbi:MAG: MFS transporter [Gammaproteobacteria bacterium]